MRAFGCLFLLVFLLLWGSVEWWAYWQVERLIEGGIVTLSLLLALTALGLFLIRKQTAQLPQAMLGGKDFGSMAVGLLGCVLLILPGFFTAALGGLLQLPPLQRLLRQSAGKLLGTIIKQAVQRTGMQMPGQMPGGFPGGMPPGGFPGMPTGAGLRPDQRRQAGRTIDVHAEKK